MNDSQFERWMLEERAGVSPGKLTLFDSGATGIYPALFCARGEIL
jgi:hypothetical protein